MEDGLMVFYFLVVTDFFANIPQQQSFQLTKRFPCRDAGWTNNPLDGISASLTTYPPDNPLLQPRVDKKDAAGERSEGT